MSSPRPILKRASPPPSCSSSPSSPPVRPSHHDRVRSHTAVVHFPPSPTLTRTFAVYSAASYDRSPIVVGPNTCALPERGCPGRTYTLEEREVAPCEIAPCSYDKGAGRSKHPRSMSNQALGLHFGDEDRKLSIATPYPSDLPPPLVPDLSSSESDESDGVRIPERIIGDVPKHRKRVRSPSRRRPSNLDNETSPKPPSWNKYRNVSDKSLRPCILALPEEGCFGGF
jgi:hypothetical protein